MSKLGSAQHLDGAVDEELRKGNVKEAARLEREAQEWYREIIKEYPGTLAAGDARELLLGKYPPNRPAAPNPDDPKAIPPVRLADMLRCVDLALLEGWRAPLQRTPATVIDKGILRHVPYHSYRAGDYEINVYGDPDHPACLEIGVGKSLRKDARAPSSGALPSWRPCSWTPGTASC